MNQSRIRVLVNVTLVSALAVLLWLGLARPGLQSDATGTLLSLDTEHITRVRLQGHSVTPIELHRDRLGWRVQAPGPLPVSPRLLRDLLSIPGAPTFARYALDSVDAESLGLEPPGATLELNGQSVDFGDRAPIEGHRYARTEQGVSLISNAHFDTVTRSLAEFAGPRLLPEGWRLDRIDLPRMRLEKTSGDGWRAIGETAPGPEAARALAEQWEQATAAAVQDWVPGLATVASLVLYTDPGGEELVFNVETLGEAPDFVLARPSVGLRYHFAPQQGAALMGIAPTDPPAPD